MIVRIRFCYYSDSPENVADAYISNVLGISSYSCVKHGGEYPLYDCIECSENSLIFDYDKGTCFCFNCGFSTNLSNIDFCCNCGEPIKASEDDGILLCSNCLDYKMNKDD
jgi:hypothetical protein